jgi:hypothetical protein
MLLVIFMAHMVCEDVSDIIFPLRVVTVVVRKIE